MLTYPADDLDQFSLAERQRFERLKWVFWGVSAMLLVIGGFYLQQKVEVQTLHAYGLTVLVYGHLLYVEELTHIKRLWLWKGIVVTIPLHIVAVITLLRWDTIIYAESAYTLTGVLSAFFAAEIVIFSAIVDNFKSRASPDEPRRKIARLLVWKSKPKPRATITLEDEDDSDAAKVLRSGYVRWFFWCVGAVVAGIYIFKGTVITGARLYITEAVLLTLLCYGHFLYVEGRDELRSGWLWVAVLVSFPFHVALFGIIVAIDKVAPEFAPNPIVLLGITWGVAWVESQLMDQIIDDYRPWASPSESAE
jgi:hypothetical protein